MYRHPSRPLVASSKIVRYPCDVAWESRVYATHGDEDSSVDNAWNTTVCGGRDTDYEADSDGAHACEDVGRALARAIGEPGHGDC